MLRSGLHSVKALCLPSSPCLSILTTGPAYHCRRPEKPVLLYIFDYFSCFTFFIGWFSALASNWTDIVLHPKS